MKPLLWFDPGFGASGDMMLGTLLGLGAPLETIRSGLQSLDVEGWSLGSEPTVRCSLSATRALVDSNESHHHRTWSSIDTLLADSSLPAAVKAGSRRTFRRLGEVEAGIHRVDIDDVHFHEVGAVDAIVDIVGSWLALDALGIGDVASGPVGLGHGSVEAAHGTLPIPAPATAELLSGATVRPVDVAAETVTPTGAALLITMVDRWEPIPEGVLLATTRGAGGRNPDHYPNVLTAYLLQPSGFGPAGSQAQPDSTGDGATIPVEQQPRVVLATNLDDATPEVIAHTIARCLAAGADDAWATPIIMKKGRPAVELNVLVAEESLVALRHIVFSETGTLGSRVQPVTKHVLERSFSSVTVRGHVIAMKTGPYGTKPEYEDLAAASEALEIPVRQMVIEALQAFDYDQKVRQLDDSFSTGISDDQIHRPNS